MDVTSESEEKLTADDVDRVIADVDRSLDRMIGLIRTEHLEVLRKVFGRLARFGAGAAVSLLIDQFWRAKSDPAFRSQLVRVIGSFHQDPNHRYLVVATLFHARIGESDRTVIRSIDLCLDSLQVTPAEVSHFIAENWIPNDAETRGRID